MDPIGMCGKISKPSRRAPRTGRAALAGLCLALCACGESRPDRDGAAAAVPAAQPILAAFSDATGFVAIDGPTGRRLEALLLDPSGAPLAGYAATYIGASPEPIVAFENPETGRPAGTFCLVGPPPRNDPAAAGLASGKAAGEEPLRAVFVLYPDAPRRSALLDPAARAPVADLSTNLDGAHPIENLGSLLVRLASADGLLDAGRVPLGELLGRKSLREDRALLFVPPSLSPPGSLDPILLTRAPLDAWSWKQDRAYVYHVFKAPGAPPGHLLIPLGLDATATLTSPVPGEVFTEGEGTDVPIAGRVTIPHRLFRLPGGRIEVSTDGGPAFLDTEIGADPAGETRFLARARLDGTGRHRIEVDVFLPPGLRGFWTDDDGRAYHLEQAVAYEPDSEMNGAPRLSGLSYPTEAPVPAGRVALAFEVADPEGDVVAAHEKIRWSFGGTVSEAAGSAPVAGHPELGWLAEGGRGRILVAYAGASQGDWLEWLFWVEDAEGRASHPLQATIALVASAPAGAPRAAGGTPGLLTPLHPSAPTR